MAIEKQYFDRFEAKEINRRACLTIIDDTTNTVITLPPDFRLRTGGGNYEGYTVHAIGGGKTYTLRKSFDSDEKALTAMQDAMGSWASLESSLRRV